MEVDNILGDMWDNLGRVIGEFPHISKLDIYNDSRVQLEGIEQIDRIREGARPGIFLKELAVAPVFEYAYTIGPIRGERHTNVITMTTAMNELMESWIREQPGQWLWIHRRWPD